MHQSPLLKIISDNAKTTDNKCGLTAVQLAYRSGISFAQIKADLEVLKEDGSIIFRDGIQGKLIFINNN